MDFRVWHRLPFLPSLALGLLVIPLNAAQPEAAIAQIDILTPACKAAIFDVEREIETHRRTFTNGVSVIDVSGGFYEDPPRPFGLYVSLDAYDSVARGDIYSQSSALDFLASPQLLSRFTQEITTACEEIGAVTFGLTEYQSRQFGLVNDAVQEFRCIRDDGSTDSLTWGDRICP